MLSGVEDILVSRMGEKRSVGGVTSRCGTVTSRCGAVTSRWGVVRSRSEKLLVILLGQLGEVQAPGWSRHLCDGEE